MAKKKTDNDYWKEWEKLGENIRNATPIDLNESVVDKAKRIAYLEKNDEEWFKYYFVNFYSSEPADFHIKATKRIMNNPEWYEVRAWSRENSKSGRTMMEFLKLCLTGQLKNVLLISNSFDNAKRLLLPYKVILEANNRIINDYGKQVKIGSWEAHEFTSLKGFSFRALGAGQSPRGTRQNEYRPDGIIFDDIDTDEECRNADIIKQKIDWIEQAVIPTRSVSGNLRIVVCGNLIANYCCVSEMAKKADCFDVVNIVDKDGNPTWKRNSIEKINRIKGMVSYNSFQKEYMNNPIIEGTTFKELIWDNCPPLNTCDAIVTYADPATSEKRTKGASTKVVVVIGVKDLKYYVYLCFCDNASNSDFVDWLFEANTYLIKNKVDTHRIYIENNSLQAPFYTQVLWPLILKIEREKNINLNVVPDTRKKPDKFERIEGTLEPKNRIGRLIFNKKQESNPHMIRASQQMLGVSPNCKTMDAPDAIEGGVWILERREVKSKGTYRVGKRVNQKY